MPLPEPRMDAQRARKKWKKYPDVQRAALALIEAEWHLYEHTSGHVSAWCPHGHPGQGSKPIRISGTPQNDGNHANRLGRETGWCPDQHHLLDAR